MKYYQSSELMIGWTSQHGCGINPQTHCDMIIQYRCDTLMRNGVSRERPEDNLDTAESEPSGMFLFLFIFSWLLSVPDRDSL